MDMTGPSVQKGNQGKSRHSVHANKDRNLMHRMLTVLDLNNVHHIRHLDGLAIDPTVNTAVTSSSNEAKFGNYSVVFQRSLTTSKPPRLSWIVTVPVQDGWTDRRTDKRPVLSLGYWSPQRAVPSPDGGEDGCPVHRKHCIQGAPRLRPTQTYTQFAKDCVGPGKVCLGACVTPKLSYTETYAILDKLSVGLSLGAP
ncbi:hypothetical protein B0H19DRAFT_1061663 [Mycena capillaripes]|nr:hypothetical protein B0H19DRAFT_1061663 [Mycena capillaripes]